MPTRVTISKKCRKRGHDAIVNLLSGQVGVETGPKDKNGMTPLVRAANGGMGGIEAVGSGRFWQSPKMKM